MSKIAECRGFTLIELLVSIVLLSLVMTGLAGTIWTVSHAGARQDERIRRNEELRTTDRFLREILGSIAPRLLNDAPGAPRVLAFEGTASNLRWIGVMPARHGAGGLYRFRLSGEAGSAGDTDLRLDFAPMVNPDTPLEGGEDQTRVMVRHVKAVGFRYQGDAQQAGEWLTAWTDERNLPRRIVVQIRTESADWPDIVIDVVPVVGPGSDTRTLGGGSGVQFGPL